MRIVFRPEAHEELLQARAWYESKATGLGLEFARAVEAAVALASRNPDAASQVASDCRRLLLRRFPFSLVYRARADELVVLAVFHHRRSPAKLVRRIKD